MTIVITYFGIHIINDVKCHLVETEMAPNKLFFYSGSNFLVSLFSSGFLDAIFIFALSFAILYQCSKSLIVAFQKIYDYFTSIP